MIIEIGNKKKEDITAEHMIDIIMIIGACNSLEYWNKPVVLEFDNTMFSDTIVVDYVSYRKSDNLKGQEYSFFFNYEKFSWYFVKDLYNSDRDKKEDNIGRNLGIPELRYLIKQGFDVPLYST